MSHRSRTPLVIAAVTALAAALTPAAVAVPAADPPGPDKVESRDLVAEKLVPAETTPEPGVEREPAVQKLALGRGSAERTYLIRLAGDAVPTYRGGVGGMTATAPRPGRVLDPSTPRVREYTEFLEAEQEEFVTRMERTVDRDVEIPFTYQYAVNGVSAVLTPEEAAEIAKDPAVAHIALDKEHELHTDAGPAWSNADALWNAVEELGLPEDYQGEGVVIGTIDTGINPGSPSFAETGDDGYTHTNPLGAGNYLGACDPSNTDQYDPDFPCNGKLIGAYGFLTDSDRSALDEDGHGTHTASTSGGNVVDDVVPTAPEGTDPPTFDVSGVAPHANVISYRGCCTTSGLTASIDQAIADGVDVINYSIGSSAPSDLWNDFDTIGFLNARAAGIFVATSNGNDGPGVATTGSPADAPWLTSVGASTHNRHGFSALIDLTSSAGDLPDLTGKSLTGPLPATEIVYAGDFGDAQCQDTSGHEAEYTGKIVVCDRGVGARVGKSENVAAQGAAGFVLANNEVNGDSLIGEAYAVNGVFLTYQDGVTLKNWLAEGTGHTAGVARTTFTVDDALGDVMASFSSRGPNRAVDTIVPSITAPGVDILAAYGVADGTYDHVEYATSSGTSMSSPHVAGAGALLTQARPDWTPAEQQSALMTTARTGVRNHDGAPATPYTQGSGHMDIGAAVQAGLLFDETPANYVAANPEEGGDPSTLNLPSFAETQCLATCSWQRTAEAPASAPAGVTWSVSAESDPGLALTVDLSQATVSPGDSMDISVTADVAGAPEGETLFGRITLTPSDPDVPDVTLPVAVVPSVAVLPDEVDISTRRDTGSQAVSDLRSIAVSDFTGSVRGLAAADLHEGSLVQDPTNDSPYDDLSQVQVTTVEVPGDAERLVAEITQATAPDLDLFVGTGDTPSADTQVCASTSGSAAEYCEVPEPDAGTWWVLVQNWGGSDNQPDTHTLATAVVPSADLGNAGVAGPDGEVPVGEPYDVRVHWDLPDAEEGDLFYGTAVLGSSPDTPGDIGEIPLRLSRVADDVTKSASTDAAAIGDTIGYDLTIEPNVTPEDLTYTITDTVPDGLTIDPASVTGGGVVDGQTITWEVDMPTSVGVAGAYEASTPDTSPQCAAWSGFVDLGAVGIGFSSLDGDSAAVSAFSSIGPFPHYSDQSPNLTVSDDGLITIAGGYGGSPWEPQAVPAAAAPNGVIAPLWSDLELSLANDRGVRLATSGGEVAVVQWDDPLPYGADPADLSNSVGKFQTWIYNSVADDRPEITFEYGELGALPALATIGIENLAGTLGTAVVNAGDPSSALTEGGSICLDYVGPSIDPVTLSYEVTVDPDAISGTYTNTAEHVTSDPFDEPAVASADVAVTGLAPCDEVITGRHHGKVSVTEGTTCIDDATVLGRVSVSDGAGLRVTDSKIVALVRADGASEVRVCDSRLTGALTVTRSSGVTIGDPAANCGGNRVTGPVTVTRSEGPVIGDNRIVGPLACYRNDPEPTNNGAPNTVTGRQFGQCREL
ncbi:S8 family serine peptidase [Myceligenerans pegani]|uniref:S8 family serine peptidase n=1 Tax=Myceligenerans pegani TaxID=2776917 RepID=A0ABR9MVY3_9MICO|nr:S8 family serine peptidase [Myceligenerans sp. TRM 65318]MBE1875547.1 S8 family serine peptidase [Myceligenerans sp. TRM 65318]MBE3017818.1 S8 family serine peptidase [Myceligenerans sp. TRM 65318]